MPRRRKLQSGWVQGALNILQGITGLDRPVVHQMLTIAKSHHEQRTGHYGMLANPLTNYKKQRVTIPTVTQRRSSPISETSGKKILSISRSMPTRKKSTKRSSKKNYRRQKYIPLGIPSSRVVRFKLVNNFSLSGATGAVGTAMIKANSLNDATGGLGANLPLYLDQWASLYQKYICLGSKLTVRFSPTANTGAGVVGIHLADNSTALSNISHYKEAKLTTQKLLSTQKDLAVVQSRYSGKKFWKLTNIKDDSEQEAAFSTTPGDPTDIAYYHIYCGDMYGASTFTVDGQLELEFICLLTDPITPDRSSL